MVSVFKRFKDRLVLEESNDLFGKYRIIAEITGYFKETDGGKRLTTLVKDIVKEYADDGTNDELQLHTCWRFDTGDAFYLDKRFFNKSEGKYILKNGNECISIELNNEKRYKRRDAAFG